MYKIKQMPSDFIVEELPLESLGDNGDYNYFWLTKTDYTTNKAVEKIARFLKVPLKTIGYAGTKDRTAITKQLISIKNTPKELVLSLNDKLKDISLEFYCSSSSPLSLGDLKGNKFTITVRNLLEKNIISKIPSHIPNYFGEQRFSKNNPRIGKFIIKKDFKKAIDTLLLTIGDLEERMRKHLIKSPSDYIGALKLLPKKILLLYVHSYQSFIWNQTVESYLSQIDQSKIDKNKMIPIIGFSTEIDDPLVLEIIEKLMQNENITFRDFIIRQIPHISSEGDMRSLFMSVTDVSIKTLPDDLNKGKKKQLIKFTLPKGCYATTLLRFLYNHSN